ncbi:transposase family protein [Myceligenerans sp. TRM 65318]|uniref:Transposase family protein n=1 Tax=Myceligenerans pegani TaxID=2776917 RepID=A0ABR9N0A7_9MICO|nr:transposase family protein [Myceligenerans sp. TRM 65318]MBE3018865.1 transposase family protein [Myceligenerans sp. TRM 65318]
MVQCGGGLVVSAVTAAGLVRCPVCGVLSECVHALHERSPADLPVAGVRVELRVRVRRLVCQAAGCARKTFREQVPGVLERYQRRMVRLAGTIATVVTELAARASVRVLPALGIETSRDTALRTLRGIPLPAVEVPRVLGIDDFALRRGQVYATVMIDATTGRRVDVIECRGADVVKQWLLDHPGGRGLHPGRVDRLRPGDPRGAARRRAGRRPVAPVAQPRRSLSARRSPPTRHAGPARRRPGCARAASPRPRPSGGSRSTTCAPPVSGFWTAPGGSVSR